MIDSSVLPDPVPSGPVSLTARLSNSGDAATQGLFLPFEPGVGAAAFARGDDTLVVFDVPRPFDLAGVQDSPTTAGSSVQLLPEATVLKLPGRRADTITLRRVSSGWLVQSNVPGNSGKAIAPVMDGATLRLPVETPGRTVIVPDPATGGNLLVGTVRSGRDAVVVGRRGSVDVLEPTILGVAVTALSDRLELRATKDAFLLTGMGADAVDVASLGSGVDAQNEVGATRVMSLRARPLDVLVRRFDEARASAAEAPAAARFLPRMLAAEAALALGDAAEAATIVRVAIADDARAAATTRPRLILAAAALLGHHPEVTDLLDDPQSATDSELGLWRAVKLAMREPASTEAARLFAASLPLLQSYPEPLQAALMPLAAEALARGGNEAQAAMVERLPPSGAIAFPQALLAARRGQRRTALAALDHLAGDRDLVLADKAAEEAVAIRQSAVGVDFGKLADILEAHLLDARISGHEVQSRYHLADLRAKAGQWSKALDVLRETAALFPDQQAETRRRVGEDLKRLVRAQSKSDYKEALDQAAMIETNADMLPDGPDGRSISLFLADKLSDLDLPERAAPIVQKMMRASKSGADKAELGLRLATLDFRQNNLAGVQSALNDSDAGDLSPDLVGRRLLVLARAFASAGQLDQALSTLSTLDTASALDLKASLLGRRGAWGTAADVLLDLAGRGQRPGKLDAAGQDLLLRLASAASRSRDKARIASVRSLGSGRFADPGKEALFRLLTPDAAGDAADPARISAEVAALHHTSAVLNAIAN